MSLTQSLGRFVSELSPNRVPEEAARIARIGFIDCVGVMIAGRMEEPTKILQDVLDPPIGDATLYFNTRKARAEDAACINGVAAHALDYDDVALRGHPSAVLVPAILAEAETLDVTGREMVTAYVAGYETWAELLKRETGYHHGKGWHPTGIFGAIAAAAACASLRRLDPERSAQALALAASQSAGLMANFGTMTKPFHAGRSAQSGVISARLVEAGFTASSDALEHQQGFLQAFSPAGSVDRDSPAATLGETWAIVENGLSIKQYPTCYCTHRAIDSMLSVVQQHPLEPADVAGVTVHLSDNYATILRNHQPRTGLAAKFSIQFAMASAIIAKRVGLMELTDGFVQREDVQALMRRVSVETNTDYDSEDTGGSVADKAVLRLTSGATLPSEQVRRARGHAENPLSEADLFVKFNDCLSVGKSAIAAATLFERLKGMEHTSARSLTRMH